MWIVRCLAALFGMSTLAVALLCILLTADAHAARLRADGTRFELQLDDGRVLHSHELIGAELQLDDDQGLRIDAVDEQHDLHGKSIWLHRLSVRGSNGAWRSMCLPHSDGTQHALLVAGREKGDGTLLADNEGGFVVTCTAGAQAKCVRFGYRPWEPGLLATYNACIRMVRADYGGDGRPYTENGRLIDLYDDRAIQTADLAADQTFEAGWDEHGAVCVHHPRVAANATLAELRARHARLAEATGDVCTEAAARERGALIFNRSKP